MKKKEGDYKIKFMKIEVLNRALGIDISKDSFSIAEFNAEFK